MKKLLITLAALAICLGGLWFSRPVYRSFKEKRFVAQAAEYSRKSDSAKAALFARQALQINPTNPVSTKIMADLADHSNSPQVLAWRQRVVELEPTVENKIALGMASIRYEPSPFSIAEKMVRELAASGSTNARYQMLASELALKRRNFPQAEIHLQKVLALSPTNDIARVNLAVLQLESPDAKTVAAAREILEKMQGNSEHGLRGLRSLVENALKRNELEAAENFSKKLLGDSRAMFIDRLVHLTVLQRKKSPGFEEYLGSIQKTASTNAENIYKLVSWMNVNQLSDAALQWIKSLPTEMQGQQPVPIAEADCYAAKKEWSRLETFLSEQKWGDRDFIRAAMLARALDAQKQDMGADVQWQKAIRLASDKMETLSLLVGMAEGLGNRPRVEEALWAMWEKYPAESGVPKALLQSYYSTGNTRGLQKVYARLAEKESDTESQNNYALLSLLLGLNVENAHRLGEEVFRKEPKNPSYLSTHAFSLHLQDKDAEARKLFEQLTEKDLENPAVAGYYGVILASAKQTEKARKYLDLAKSAPLLPEEKMIMEAARKKL
ncbi:MAG: hypothetical protein ABI042_00765 [Verrucomicrobiota bacterium]